MGGMQEKANEENCIKASEVFQKSSLNIENNSSLDNNAELKHF